MSRKLKMKRQIIEEANRRLLGEQNEKLSDDYINKLQRDIQGLVAVEVNPGDNIGMAGHTHLLLRTIGDAHIICSFHSDFVEIIHLYGIGGN